ncbi:low molecular weight phosphotyrosine protein phosphatase [Catenovulum sp. SM1970]|uniref:low molecular weight protein-tyrosine-phosphatase n=1 Tax=Marinifaba aquimaris TaxID=2741323 RepID=UPI001571E6D2|nr:low molecular weight protein-tyrosine-phosphatase [Marinifaba aquimaris]NTS76980.1 low molecular weight phosphotyrosine protein phosphatase [Marinifaba aquimaris]
MGNVINAVLFVCLGNICRSPTAHAVFRSKVKSLNLPISYDSAGTASYHIGATPDKRSAQHGKKRGYDFSELYARAVSTEDFETFDLILAMDKSNYDDLMNECPEHFQHKIHLFLDFAENYPDHQEVPDPYYGGEEGFELVLDLVEDACNGLINKIK